MRQEQAPETAQDSAILQQQILAVRGQLPVILLLNLPLLAVLSWIYWPWVDHLRISLWVGCMLLVMVVRWVLFVALAARLSRALSTAAQQRVFVANSALSGLLWGWAGVLFFVPAQLDYQLIILMVLIVKGAGSVSVIANSLAAFYAYFPVSMLPVSGMFLAGQDTTSVLLGLISLGFTAILLLFGRNLNLTLLESLRIRYENQRLLREAESRKQQAETANREKTRFLAAASHDLRQPVHALSLLLNLLEEQPERTDSAAVIGRMRGSMDSLQHLLDSLLDISRLDAGAVQVDLRDVDLLEVCRPLVDEFQVLAEAQGVSLHWPRESVVIRTDRLLLEQVLRNLLANALRFTPQGEVWVECERSGDQVRIQVRDTGVGIDAADQAAIFDEFHQVGNPQRDRRQGLGLGLAIVARIVSLLGSRIELESSLGHGACFGFELAAGVPGAVSETSDAVLVPGLHPELDRCVVLIEDDQEVRDAMQLALESWGCRTFVGGDAATVIPLLSAVDAAPDVVISDLQLAENRDGVQEVFKLRQALGAEVPALIITGDIQAEHLSAVRASGLPVLRKPVAPARLRAFLRARLSATPG